MAFAAGLDRWWLSGSFVQNAIASHWQDYSSAAEDGVAVLAATVPQPEGFAFLAQTIYADDYRGTEVVFRGRVRIPPGAGRAGLFMRIRMPADHGLPLTEAAALADSANHIVTVEDRADWIAREVAVQVPADTETIVFGVFLAGPGRIELRDPELARAGLALSTASITPAPAVAADRDAGAVTQECEQFPPIMTLQADPPPVLRNPVDAVRVGGGGVRAAVR